MNDSTNLTIPVDLVEVKTKTLDLVEGKGSLDYVTGRPKGLDYINTFFGDEIFVDKTPIDESLSNSELLQKLTEESIDGEMNYSEIYKLHYYDNILENNDLKKNYIFRTCECGFYGFIHMKRIKCPECKAKFPNYKKNLRVNRRNK